MFIIQVLLYRLMLSGCSKSVAGSAVIARSRLRRSGQEYGQKLTFASGQGAARAHDVIAGQKLPSQFKVRLRPTRTCIVQGHRLAMTGRLGKPDIARNHGVEEPVFEVRAERFADLLSEIGAVVVHGEYHAL